MNTPILPLAHYRLRFRAAADLHLPDYAGSAWRGAFGHALKRLVCVTREPACPGCLLYRSCIYPYVFETPPDPEVGKLRKYTAAPHPFVLTPGPESRGAVSADTPLTLELTLFGHGNRHLPYLIHALDQAGQRGLGRDRGRLTLEQVAQHDPAQDTWQEIYRPGASLNARPAAMLAPPPRPARVALELATPLRLKQDGRNLSPDRFNFGALFSNLLRRISMLTAFHTDTPLETDFAGLTRAARAFAAADATLRWHDWTRYSTRQDALMQMGGLLGRIELDGAELEPFWPYLWLGQWTHAGKGTSMGLGKYRIVI